MNENLYNDPNFFQLSQLKGAYEEELKKKFERFLADQLQNFKHQKYLFSLGIPFIRNAQLEILPIESEEATSEPNDFEPSVMYAITFFTDVSRETFFDSLIWQISDSIP